MKVRRSPLPGYQGGSLLKGLCGLLLTFVSLPLCADGIETWVTQSGLITCRSQVTSANLMGVVHGAGRYVAWSDQWGDQGNLWSSEDGTSWESAVGPVEVNSVAFGNGLFVAVGGRQGICWVSSDGLAWESRATPMLWASRVTHGEAGFVAYGADMGHHNGLFRSSSDSWTKSASVSDISALAYGDGRYVAPTTIVQPPQPGSAATSVWVGQTVGLSITWGLNTAIDQPLELTALAYGNGRYVAVGWHRDGAGPRIAVSTDAQDWTVSGVPGREMAWLQGIAYGNGRFVAVGDQGLVLISTDGFSWVDGPGPVPETLRGAAWGDQGWVVVGDGGVAYALGSSLDIPMLDRHLHGAVYAAGRYVVVGEGGTIGVSMDGADWATHTVGGGKPLLGLTYGDGRYVVVGAQGGVLRSLDGTFWAPQISGTEAWLSAVAYGNGQFVAAGDQGTILVSSDGEVWQARTSGTTNWLKDVVYAAGRFVAVGGRSLLSSVDGIVWLPHAGLRDLEAVAYGDGLWVAVGGTAEVRKDSGSGMGMAYTSRDGETWQRHKLSSLPWLGDVTYVGGWFVAVVGGDIGGVLRSPDGVRWEVLPVGEVQGLNALCSDGETVLAVGDSGSVVQSGFIKLRDADALAYDPLDHWQARIPYPTHLDLNRCVCGEGRFVALGNRFEKEHSVLLNRESSILTSLDGVHWDRVFWDYGPVELFGLAYGQGQFVAVGERGLILMSDDGSAWQEIDSGLEETLTDVAYGDGRFVAVGLEGSVLSSLDGRAWAKGELGAAGWLPWIRFGGGLFLAGLDSPGRLMASTDGLSWSQTATDYVFSDIAFGPDGFRALGGRHPEGAWGLWRSSDGVEWTKTSVVGAVDRSWRRIWHCGGLFFATGSSSQGVVFVYRDGEQWERIDRGPLPWFNDVAYGSGRYLVVGGADPNLMGPVSCDPPQVATSRNGSQWTTHATGPTYPLEEVAFGDGVIVALPQVGPGALRSDDGGLSWTETVLSEGCGNRDVAFGSGRFVAVSGAPESALGEIAVSDPDGGWTILEGRHPPLARVAYGAGRFVAVGNQGSLLTSSDGLAWEAHPTGLEADLTAAVFGQPGFVVLGSGGWIGLSPDGESWTWTQQTRLTDEPPRAVAWGNDRYVAVADRTILVSPDGQTWERYRSDAFDALLDVTYGSGRFVVAGGCGTVLSSVAGRTWRLHDAGMGFQLRGAVFGGAGFVLTGGASPGLWNAGWGSGLVLQSDPVVPVAPVVRMLDARREVAGGEPFTLAVAVSGSPPLSYQWFRGQTPVAGATGRQFAVLAAGLHDAGSYFVEVSNAVGSARAGPVPVWVDLPPKMELRVNVPTCRVAPATVRVEALVADPEGEVVAVEFYLEQELIGVDATAPFSCQAPALEPGVYHWRAWAINDAGVVSAISGVVSVRVISPDPLLNWSTEPSGLGDGVSAIAYHEVGYLVRLWGSIGFSTDLAHWEVMHLRSGFRLILYGDGWYVRVAEVDPNTIWRSRDGRVWELVPITPDLKDVWLGAGAYGGGRFVMVGSGGDSERAYAIRSTGSDATGWVLQRLSGMRRPNAIAYGGGRFVAVGYQGKVVWSVDGAQWQVPSSPTTSELRGVAYGNGRFVAVGDGGTIVTSNDGSTWGESESGTVEGLNGVAFGGEAFAAVGNNGTILKSLDGARWDACLGGGKYGWSTVVWAQGRFVAMGPEGLMVRTDATTILDSLRLTLDGRLVCGFVGMAGRNYRLERSENLIEWTEAAAAAGIHGAMELEDPALPTTPYRFYRVLWTP